MESKEEIRKVKVPQSDPLSSQMDNIIHDKAPDRSDKILQSSDSKRDEISIVFEEVKEHQAKVNTAIHWVKELDQTVLITTTPNRAKFSFYTNIT